MSTTMVGRTVHNGATTALVFCPDGHRVPNLTHQADPRGIFALCFSTMSSQNSPCSQSRSIQYLQCLIIPRSIIGSRRLHRVGRRSLGKTAGRLIGRGRLITSSSEASRSGLVPEAAGRGLVLVVAGGRRAEETRRRRVQSTAVMRSPASCVVRWSPAARVCGPRRLL